MILAIVVGSFPVELSELSDVQTRYQIRRLPYRHQENMCVSLIFGVHRTFGQILSAGSLKKQNCCRRIKKLGGLVGWGKYSVAR